MKIKPVLAAFLAGAIVLSAQAATLPAVAQSDVGTAVAVGVTPLGKALVDSKGMVLYMYTEDTKNTSVCYDRCAFAWPPLLTTGAPVAAAGVNKRLLGTTTRKDGKLQVTYNGLPLYYWFKDKAAGDWLGQDVGKVWYMMTPAGKVLKTSGAKVTLGTTPLGQVITDEKGKVLYLFTRDSKDGPSVCYDKCAVAWPPLLTKGAPSAGEGVDGKKIGVTKRKDGNLQVTYNGFPVYYWFQDKVVGDWLGQDVGSVWYMMQANGDALFTEGARLIVGSLAPGNVLVGQNGLTLYMYTEDEKGVSNCYDKCATAWPPLITKGAPHIGAGGDSKLLGVTKRKDGQLQVTYNGMPLYYWFKDTKPGDVTGQDVGHVWYVVSAKGEVIK